MQQGGFLASLALGQGYQGLYITSFAASGRGVDQPPRCAAIRGSFGFGQSLLCHGLLDDSVFDMANDSPDE